jgi:hypothetical protein
MQADLRDLRLFSFNTQGDTLEAPYILEQGVATTSLHKHPLKELNRSRKGDLFQITLESQPDQLVNEIYLDFKEGDFDYKITIEGGQSLSDFSEITRDARVLAIKNSEVDYRYSKVLIPASQYRYFKISFLSAQAPQLIGATLLHRKTTAASYINHPIADIHVFKDIKQRQTQIELNLPYQVPLSFLQFKVTDNIDFCRNLTLQYLRDSVKTEQGWHYNFITLGSPILSSLETPQFQFNEVLSNRFRVIVHNHNSPPLQFEQFVVKGFQQKLIARFDTPGPYYLYYGKASIAFPQYDIVHFKNNIPKEPPVLTIGPEESIKSDLQEKQPLFKNKAWLWAVMALLAGLIFWASFKMIKAS